MRGPNRAPVIGPILRTNAARAFVPQPYDNMTIGTLNAGNPHVRAGTLSVGNPVLLPQSTYFHSDEDQFAAAWTAEKIACLISL